MCKETRVAETNASANEPWRKLFECGAIADALLWQVRQPLAVVQQGIRLPLTGTVFCKQVNGALEFFHLQRESPIRRRRANPLIFLFLPLIHSSPNASNSRYSVKISAFSTDSLEFYSLRTRT
jgi:hypothetical protein